MDGQQETPPAQVRPGIHVLGADTDPSLPTASAASAVRGLAMALERQRQWTAQVHLKAGPSEMRALESMFAGPRTPTELARELMLTTAAVTGLIDRLTAQGLVERHAHPRDRRKVLVSLTSDARAAITDLRSHESLVIARAVAHLAEPQLIELVDALRHLTREITADLEAAPDRGGDVRQEDGLAGTLERIHAATRAFARSEPRRLA